MRNHSAPIRPITGRLLLSPASSARCVIGPSCDGLSSEEGRIGFTLFRIGNADDLAPAYPPAAFMSVCFHWSRNNRLRTFWFKPDSIFGLSYLTAGTAVHLGWACHPAWPSNRLMLAVADVLSRDRPYFYM
jgi:hypothetical protein